MAILISKQDTDITTNQFYRVETANMGVFGSFSSQLNTERLIPVTFANAGNCLGIVIQLRNTVNHRNFTFRSVEVKLQEFVAGVWTDRANVTLTTNQIVDANNTNPAGRFLVPFEFTSPYAVNTTAGIWRFRAISTGANTTDWFICSQTTAFVNPIYAAYCDTQLTPVSGADQIIFKNYVDITSSFVFKGILGLADSVRGYCAWVCRNVDATPVNVCFARVPSSIVSLVTIGIDGFFVLSSHGGFRAGTQALPIGADLLKIELRQVTVGSSTSGFIEAGANAVSGVETNRLYLLLYGAVPAKKFAFSTNVRTVGATTIDVDDPSVFAVDDIIVIGRRISETAEGGIPRHRITGIAGNTLTFTTSLAGANSAIGARVVKTYNNATNNTGYGVSIRRVGGTSAYTFLSGFGLPSGLVLRGVFLELSHFNGGNNQGVVEDASYNLGIDFTNCLFLSNSILNSYVQSYGQIFQSGPLPYNQLNIDSCIIIRSGIAISLVVSLITSGPVSATFIATRINLTNVIVMTVGVNTVLFGQSLDGGFAGIQVIADGVNIDNLGSGRTGFQISGTVSSYKNIDIYGSFPAGFNQGAVRISSLIDSTVENVKVNNALTAFNFEGTNSGVVITNTTLGDVTANTTDIRANTRAFTKTVFKGVTGNPTFNTPEMLNMFAGSEIAFENANATNVDFIKRSVGDLVRTGTGLADTTVRTAGGFALRFQSQSTARNLVWVTSVPTGNIQNKTMVVGVWVNITNAGYYAGVHQNPRLTVSFDNGVSSAFAEALDQTGWQFVSVPFTPTTTFGQVTLTFSTNTDAVGANAYVYFDDFTGSLPQGSELNLGSMDLWSNALPVNPLNFATAISATDVWSANPATFGASTVGDRVNKIKNDTGIIPSLL